MKKLKDGYVPAPSEERLGSICRQVQTYTQLADDAAMKLTTARMMTASGKSWVDGVWPDVTLEAQKGKFEWADSQDTWITPALGDAAQAGGQQAAW